jgi:hypothetical protein
MDIGALDPEGGALGFAAAADRLCSLATGGEVAAEGAAASAPPD